MSVSKRALFCAIHAGLLTWCLAPAHAATCVRPNAVTADGGRYCGSLFNGKLHGKGVIEWRNGARYEGQFSNGLMSGQGRLRTGAGEIYVGQFHLGMMHGRGRLALRDGTVYTGEMRNDFFHGQGRQEMRDGDVYEGAFENGEYHGQGVLTSAGTRNQGEFRQGRYWGQGVASYDDKSSYRGAFVRGRQEGQGRLETANGNIYEGEFKDNAFIAGSLTRKDGARYEGGFRDWRFHGKGIYTDAGGTVYEGQFVNDDMEGPGKVTARNNGRYEGEFRQWRFHGPGVLHLPNGDVYKGEFARGVYEGEGTLTYAKPKADGRTQDSGKWRYGALPNEQEARQAKENTEIALYNQRKLLDAALAAVARRVPGKINLYLLAVAGDGSQEVFRREVEFVQAQFAEKFGTRGRSLALINSRNTLSTAPMATHTSIREALKGIAARMDTEQDVLFFFLTSHGSREHEFTINQNSIILRGLPAHDLGSMLKQSGIRWKVVVVSACYSGGFIDAIKDEYTLVITAARHDRQSFGCADDNDFTYFGRAYFKEALPQATSFEEAFSKAETLVREWEDKDRKAEAKTAEDAYSFPQMHRPAAIEQHLRLWWRQVGAGK